MLLKMGVSLILTLASYKKGSRVRVTKTSAPSGRYCGVDAEHCQGQSQPKRPSCDSLKSPIRRVVGYYEGWASRRPCQQFYPEQVAVGVYSHLNFAFASIDPGTFAVIPADPQDVELYRRLTSMKKMDPQLKVYIAIGGWAFNDPGPTQNVFSQLVASDANQKAFFRSLISFMETYDFDGVDIDWEYPAADDRAGRPQDFENWPNFVANLNSAVKSTSRGGLTVTLPVAYWYLRHFDIKKLEEHVDWFNMMSYDLHGSWDKENKWIGNYLNSHTNLTEITEYFDLMWRNDIDPDKVVMGLAFYSRTLKPLDAGCTDATCRFSTVGDRGPCTKEYGVLSNAEIIEVEKSTGATPQLDKTAAVKILKANGEWITYDDVDSWKLKVGFARGQCLGGVMVWAVSLDISDSTFSKQLQQATGYKSKGVTTTDDGGGGGGGGGHQVVGPDDAQLRSQCFWTDCGQVCPADYVAIPRSDGDGNGELMLDSTGCRDNGGVRTLCCPVPKAAGANLPQCGWFDFNNGDCGVKTGSKCGDGWAEVGSYHGACRRFGGWQVACCTATSDVQSTSLYGMCEWRGLGYPDDEDGGKCVDGRDYTACEDNGLLTDNLVDSWSGSGAHRCWWWESNGMFRFRYLGHTSYCCTDPALKVQTREWANCAWQSQTKDADGFCHSACPAGTVRVAMLDYGTPLGLKQTWPSGCKTGHSVYCCEGVYKTPTTPDEISDPFEEALQVVMDHQGECPYLNDNRRRGVEATGLALRDSHLWKRGMIPIQACSIVSDYTRKWLSAHNGPNLLQGYEKAWNDKVVPNYPHLTTDWMEQQFGQYLEVLDPTTADYEARSFENDLRLQDDWVNADSSTTIEPDLCDLLFYIINIYGDEDDGGTDGGPGFSYEYGEVDYSLGGQKKAKAKRAACPLSPALPPLSREEEQREELDRLPAVIYPRDCAEEEDNPKQLNVTLSHPPLVVENDDDDIDDDNDETGEVRRSLEKRDGNSRDFYSKKGSAKEVLIKSSSYPNADSGDQLLKLNNDKHRYIIQSDTPTGIYCRPKWHKLNTLAYKLATRTHWVTEHILELQTIPRFVDFLIDQRWPAVRNAAIPAKQTTLRIDIDAKNIQRYMADRNWASWSRIDAEHANNSPLDLMLNQLGSFDSLDTMVVCDADLNGIKAQLYRFVRPAGNGAFKKCCMGTSNDQGRSALSFLSNTAGVFDYYADADVAARHKSAYDKVKKVLVDFEAAYKSETGRSLQTSLADLWKEYLTEHYSRIVQWATWWIDDRTTLLIPIWTDKCHTATDVQEMDYACAMSSTLRLYANIAKYRPRFNPASVFT